jgi:DNA mismatch endonuclease (patch repair protein)
MAQKKTRQIALSKSEQMARIHSRDTQPELLVRRLLSIKGVRYRLHRLDLPGRPDIYIGRIRLAVFVNGCFWHGHDCPRGSRPKTNKEFWRRKIAQNINRDRLALVRLAEMGIDTITLWTCESPAFGTLCCRISRRYAKATND